MSDPLTPLTPAQTEQQIQEDEHQGFVHGVLRQADELGEKILGGKEDDTISEALARADIEDKGVEHEIGEVGSELLGDIDPDHGVKALVSGEVQAEAELNRDQQALAELKAEKSPPDPNLPPVSPIP